MKTFRHKKNDIYKLVSLPNSKARERFLPYLGKEYTLVEVAPCSYTERTPSSQLPGDLCGENPRTGKGVNFTCPGKMKFEEEPFNTQCECFGYTRHCFELVAE